METYPKDSLGDEVKKTKRIEINHMLTNDTYLDAMSSFSGYFNNEEVALYGSNNKVIYCKLGDIKEAYQLLRANIVSKSPYTIEERVECVYRAIVAYFGYYLKVDRFMSFFLSEKEKEVTDLAHKDAAPSFARAMVAQNLLLESEVKSIFKESEVMIDGNCVHHAYNIISEDGKYYIFDAYLPSVKDAKITPLICEIPKEVYDLISQPNADIGYSVSVTHFDPFQQKDINIVYDPERPFIYKAGETIQKVIE